MTRRSIVGSTCPNGRSTMRKRVGASLTSACLVAVLLATTGLTAGATWGATSGLPGTGDKSFNPAADSEGNHCVSPEGVDANELLGISEHLIVPGACDVVKTGEFYVPLTSSWTMNASWEEVPAGYTPSAPTPLEDFLSKVRSMTFTVDPGTALERSYRFAAPDILDVRTLRAVPGSTVNVIERTFDRKSSSGVGAEGV